MALCWLRFEQSSLTNLSDNCRKVLPYASVFGFVRDLYRLDIVLALVLMTNLLVIGCNGSFKIQSSMLELV